MRRTTRASAFERVYGAAVLLKGIDGVVELLLGLALLVTPVGVQGLLTAIAGELAEGSSPLRTSLAASVAGASAGLVGGAVVFALFLLVHGVVKVGTVWCLLRRAVRFYPFALAALVALLIGQSIDLAGGPSAGKVVLAVLDVVVIGLVSWEYHRLRRERAAGGEGAHGPVTTSGKPGRG